MAVNRISRALENGPAAFNRDVATMNWGACSARRATPSQRCPLKILERRGVSTYPRSTLLAFGIETFCRRHSDADAQGRAGIHSLSSANAICCLCLERRGAVDPKHPRHRVARVTVRVGQVGAEVEGCAFAKVEGALGHGQLEFAC